MGPSVRMTEPGVTPLSQRVRDSLYNCPRHDQGFLAHSGVAVGSAGALCTSLPLSAW